MKNFDKIQKGSSNPRTKKRSQCSTHTHNGVNLKYYSTLQMKEITSLFIEFSTRCWSLKEANPNFMKQKQKVQTNLRPKL